MSAGLELLHDALQPFLAAELARGNRVRHVAASGTGALVELCAPLALDTLRAELRRPADVERYETWGPREPTRVGLQVRGAWQRLAGPHPFVAALRAPLEELARALVAGDPAPIVARSAGALADDDVKKLLARLKKTRKTRPALPPDVAYDVEGCGDARAGIVLLEHPEGDAPPPHVWRLLFHVWGESGKQRDVLAVDATERRDGTPDLHVTGIDTVP